MSLSDIGSETSTHANSSGSWETEAETQVSDNADVGMTDVGDLETEMASFEKTTHEKRAPVEKTDTQEITFKEVEVDEPEIQDPNDPRSALEKLLDKKTVAREERLPPLLPSRTKSEKYKIKREARRCRYKKNVDHLRQSLPQMLDPRALAPTHRPENISTDVYLKLTDWIRGSAWNAIAGFSFKIVPFLTDEDIENLIFSLGITDTNAESLLSHLRDMFTIMVDRQDTYCATDDNSKLYFYAMVRMEHYNSLLRGGSLKKLKMAQGIAAMRVPTLMKVIDACVIARGENVLKRTIANKTNLSPWDDPWELSVWRRPFFEWPSDGTEWKNFSFELHRQPKSDTKLGQALLDTVDKWIEVLREKERHMAVFREHFDFKLAAGVASASTPATERALPRRSLSSASTIYHGYQAPGGTFGLLGGVSLFGGPLPIAAPNTSTTGISDESSHTGI